MAQHCKIPEILARMLSEREEDRPTAAELVRTPLAEFARVPSESAAAKKAATEDADAVSEATESSESASEEQ